MKRNIWIINEYAGSPYHGMEFRHYYIARELIDQGYDVTIITASYSHLFNRPPAITEKFSFQNLDGIKYIWIKVNTYPHSHSKGRIKKWLNFSISLLGLFFKGLSKPDAIIFSPTGLLSVPSVLLLKSLYRTKFLFEVKDVWPLTLIEVGNYSKNNPFILLMGYLEKLAIKKCTYIISNLPNYKSHLLDLGIKKEVCWIPNGISLPQIQNIEPLDDSIEKHFPSGFIVGYAGTIGDSNALDYLIDSVDHLDHEEIKIVIVGNGKSKEDLLSRAKNKRNIYFFPSVPKSQVQSLLARFDVCYIGWKDESLYRFGIAANKIYDYMFSGKPILHSFNGAADPILAAKCGIQVAAENPAAIAKGIRQFYGMSAAQRIEMGQSGRRYVLDNHCYAQISKRLGELIQCG